MLIPRSPVAYIFDYMVFPPSGDRYHAYKPGAIHLAQVFLIGALPEGILRLEANTNLCIVRVNGSQKQQGYRQMENRQERVEDYTQHMRDAAMLQQSGKADAALAQLRECHERAQQAGDGDFTLIFAAYLILFEQKSLARSLELVNQAVAWAETHAETDLYRLLTIRANLHLAAGDITAAERDTDRALTLSQGDHSAIRTKGMVFRHQGNYVQAHRWLMYARDREAMQKLLMEHAITCYELAITYRLIKYFTGADMSARNALKSWPEYTPAMVELGLALLYQRKLKEARSWLERALAANPANTNALFGMGYILAREEGYPAALPWIERLLAIDPNGANSAILMTDYSYAQGEFDQCLHWAERVLAGAPDHLTTLAYKAKALQRLHRDDDARAAFQRLQDVCPRYLDALLGLAVDANRRKAQPAAYDSIEELLQINRESRWRIPYDNTGDTIMIEGWYPAEFNWDILTLHTRQSQFRRLKIVCDHGPGQTGGSYPSIFANKLPIPLFCSDTIKKFLPYSEGFVAIPVQTGSVKKENHFDRWPGYKQQFLVPLPEVCFNSPDEVPPDRHLAVIAGKFCISTELIRTLNSYYTHKTRFMPFCADVVLPAPSTPDYSAVFAKRPKAQLPVVEETILNFLLTSLERYQTQYTERLGGILLDCDPKYGYIILALKQTPVPAGKRIDIDEFELDRFSSLEAEELYGDAEYLSATQFRGVLKRVIQALANHELVRALAREEHLHIAYAFHDDDLQWIVEIKP